MMLAEKLDAIREGADKRISPDTPRSQPSGLKPA